MGDPSPDRFRELLRPPLHYWSIEINHATASMDANDRKTYRKLANQRAELIRNFNKVGGEIAKVRRAFWYRSAEIREQEQLLKDTRDHEQKQQITSQLNALREKQKPWRSKIRGLEKPAYSIYNEAGKIEKKMRNIRVSQLSTDAQKEYEKLVWLVAEEKRWQGNREDKAEYRELQHQMLLY
ncbi:MAG: hypothetical protein KAU94_07845 [Verrucomicrobia bacterium]|nr:hypothetical protein [Verrucomicrobiota bacterium]